MPDGRKQEPGGWNRFALEISDLAGAVESLRKVGVRFRNELVTGVGGKQIIVEDPGESRRTLRTYRRRSSSRPS